jgi:hypothetical protein
MTSLIRQPTSIKKGWSSIQACVLCSHTLTETADRLFSNYQVTTAILATILTTSAQGSAQGSWEMVCARKKQQKMGIHRLDRMERKKHEDIPTYGKDDNDTHPGSA